MTNAKYRIRIPDYEYYQREISCNDGCPVRTDCRGYVVEIGKENFPTAYQMARGPNPFASICGRVCAAPCESACNRGNVDFPVQIRALKRVVTELYGPERPRRGAAWDRPYDQLLRGEFCGPCSSQYELYAVKRAMRAVGSPEAEGYNVGDRVAVMGSGCAGMTVAHDLALRGYKCTVFEAERIPGGMLTLGVPLFRLSRAAALAEIHAILDLGVELKLNTVVGRDVTLNQLFEQGYKAVFLGPGLQRGRRLNIEGADAAEIYEGVIHLRKYNLEEPYPMGRRVLVIGGGDVAMDCARTALRLGAVETRVMCLEPKDAMPAQDIEVEDAIEEGVVFHYSRGPRRFLKKNGRVAGVETLECSSVFDPEGRFNPQFVSGSETVIECDTVLLAIGQRSEPTLLRPDDELALNARGLIDAGPSLQTRRRGVFAGGDIVLGPKLFIDAVLQGQTAARHIHEQLAGVKVKVRRRATVRRVWDHRMVSDYMMIDEERPPLLEPDNRKQGNEFVEKTYTGEQALRQAHRCLKCHVNVVFDGNLCIMCNGCVHVCPEYCLKLVRLDDIESSPEFEQLLRKRYAAAPRDADGRIPPAAGTAMLMDAERCIRCGLCAFICPTEAITMEEFSYVEELYEVKNEEGGEGKE